MSVQLNKKPSPLHKFVKRSVMRKYLLWIFLFLFISASAQDTLTVLQYNLLNYGNYNSYCTPSNNDYHDKDGYIHTIVSYINPDIFTVCEMSPDTTMQRHLLKAALDTNGVTRYKMANFIREDTSSDLVNMLYYNSDKLGLAGHTIAQSYVRDVDVYKLYHKSNTLDLGDTVFLYCVVAHLKAGNETSDENERSTMAINTMNYLRNELGSQNNYLLMGDLNVYNSTEPAIQDFMVKYLLADTSSLLFYDPVNEVGSWHNDSAYAPYHTQSTHTTSQGCASTGGMDDRFDFILISNTIKDNLREIKYIQGTYHAVGQDGDHFNKALLDTPVDNTVPTNVVNALYHNSDHLPVTMKLLVEAPQGMNSWSNDNFDHIHFVNPVANNFTFNVNLEKRTPLTVEIFSILGQKIITKHFFTDQGISNISLDVSNLRKGLYIVRFTDKNRDMSFTRKMLKE